MNVHNKLIFKDENDKAYAKKQVEDFAKNFIDEKIYEYVEVTKDNIYLKKHNESSVSHFPIMGFQPSTAKKMMIFISTLNNATFYKKGA